MYIYIYLVRHPSPFLKSGVDFKALCMFEVAIESWPEWDLNP